MTAQPIAAMLLRQFYLMRGSPARVLPMFAWVAIDIILWGFLTRYLNTVSSSQINFVPALLGAVLLWDFFTRVLHGVTTAFFEDVWSRNFLNVFAAPISIGEYLGGLVLTSMMTAALGLVVMLVMASTIFGLSYFVYGALFIPFLLVLFLFGIALGIIGCAIVLRFGPAAEWFIWPLPALISPFAGVFYPLATLPAWMQLVARLLPPSYVFEGMRTLLRHGAVSGQILAMSWALALLDVIVACWIFMRVYRRAVRTGLIVRYSSESL